MSRDRQIYAWTLALPTRWADNDQYGHLNNATYFSLFDTALTHWQLQAGLLSDDTEAHRFLVVENGCTYHAELAFPDLIVAGLRCGKVGNSSFRLDLALFRGDAPEAAATGFFTQVQVDAKTHRPVPLSNRARQILSAIS